MKILLLLAACPWLVQSIVHSRRSRTDRFTFEWQRYHASVLVLHAAVLFTGALAVRIVTEFYSVPIALLLVALYPASLYGLSSMEVRLVRTCYKVWLPVWCLRLLPRTLASVIVILIAIVLSYEAITAADWVASYIAILVFSSIVYIDTNRRFRHLNKRLWHRHRRGIGSLV